ncbi:MAG TPA: HAD-IB family hydrolase [Solirubrobacteraceae bacterium]|nr:HAD-IB family hydrolase [Solirubrobacteraceae bacterium]
MAAERDHAEESAGPRGAAFFDLDKTLMQGSSAFQFARAAYAEGLISRRQIVNDGWANLRYRLQGASDEVSLALRERIAAGLQGTRVVELERLGVGVLAGVLPRIYPRMLRVAHEHQDAGRPAYIVTAAAQDLADILARVMALDGALGSQLSEVESGVYTGRPTGRFMYGDGKARAIVELAARDGIDLAASYAYSDSESDLPMLECVGHPVVVNPDARLRRIARERDWEVVHLDRLGRRLWWVAGLSGAAAAGGAAAVTIGRRVGGGGSSRARAWSAPLTAASAPFR